MVGDQQRRLDRAYKEASTNREGGRSESRRGTGSNDRRENQVPSPRRTRLKPVVRISLALLPFLAHSGGCEGLVGADVVKNSGYE